MTNNLSEERINFYNELKDITVEEINEMSFEAENGYVISPNKKYRVTEAIKGYKYEIERAVRNTDGYHKKADVLRDYLKEADGKKQSLIKNIDNYKHPNNFDWWEFNDANLQIHLIDSLISHITSITEENLQNENKTKKHQTPVKDKKLHTYNWIGKPQNITELHKAMKGVFIVKETKVKDFCSIFEKVDTARIKQVKWIRLPTELLQFLYEMMKAGLIKDEIKRMSYQRLIACFCKEDGSSFNEAFRSIFEQIKKDYTPVKTDIKELVKRFK